MFKKAFNKGGKRVLSFVMAAALAASSLPTLPQLTAEAEAGDVGTKPGYMGQTTYNILNAFGQLRSSGKSYNSLYNADQITNETNGYTQSGDMEKAFTDLYGDGYNFTMSRNFDSQEITLAGGDTYDLKGSRPIQSINGRDDIIFTNRSYTNWYGDGSEATYNPDTNSNYIGTLGSDSEDAAKYAIRLPDDVYNSSKSDYLKLSNDKKISCLYKNVGSYYTENTQTKVDCRLTIEDYGVANSYIYSGVFSKKTKNYIESKHPYALVTEDEYKALENKEQKALCKKMDGEIVRLKDNGAPAKDQTGSYSCIYGIPSYYYSKASDLKLWDELNKIDKKGKSPYQRKQNRYSSEYGAVLRFTPDKVGIDVEWVDWVKVKYTFYKSGTNQPISVKGQTVYKDIDWSQGVSFPRNSSSIKKFGAWRPQGGSRKDFLASQFAMYRKSGIHDNYVGLFDYQNKKTTLDNRDAWMGMAWEGSSFDAIYSFCGTRGYNSSPLRRAPMSGGTIRNDLPSDMTYDLVVSKYIDEKSISDYAAANELASVIRIRITDNDGKYMKLKATTSEGGKYTEYTYDGVTNDSTYANGIQLPLRKNTAGEVLYELKIKGIPYPCIFNVEEGITQIPNKYGIQKNPTRISPDGGNTWISTSDTIISNYKFLDVTYPTPQKRGSAWAHVIFDNPTRNNSLYIAKYVNGIRLSDKNKDDPVISQLMSYGQYNNILVWVKNSRGEYVTSSKGEYSGTSRSQGAPLSWRVDQGSPYILISGLPNDTYTVIENTSSNYISSSPSKCGTSYSGYITPTTTYTEGATAIKLEGVSTDGNKRNTGYVTLDDEKSAPAKLIVNKYVKQAGKEGLNVHANSVNTPITNEHLRFYLTNNKGQYLKVSENSTGDYTVKDNDLWVSNKSEATPMHLNKDGGFVVSGFYSKQTLYIHEESDVDVSSETILLKETGSGNTSGLPVYVNYSNSSSISITVSGTTNASTVVDVYNPAPTQVLINKYGVYEEGKEKATTDNDEQLNSTLELAIKNLDTNKYVSFVTINDIKGAYKYIGESDEAMYINLSSIDDDLRSNGSARLIAIPAGNYQVEEKVIDRDTDFVPSSQRYTLKTQQFSVYDSNTTEITNVDIVNPAIVRDLEIVKIIKDIDGNTSVPTAKVREDLIFTVKNSAGRYLRAVDGVYAGTSATEDADCQFKLGKDGKFTIKDVPRGEYTVNEKSTSDMSSIMKCDATAKITTENEGIYDAEGNVVGIKTNSGTVINDMYYGYVKIQKKTNTNKGLSGIKFVISGTSDAGVKVSTTVTTDKNGVAVSGPILVGTYTITEDKSTIPAGYIDGKTIDEVVVKRGEVADAKSYDYWNYYTEVSLTKVNAARPNIKIDGAVFAVYKDVNGNGTYEADVDKLYDTVKDFRDGHLKSVGNGKYSMSGLELGKYLIKEIVAPKSDLFTYKVDKTYYPVTIDKDHLSVQVANNGHNFEEEPEPCKITLIKRIPLDEINGNIWYQHGTPIFVLELEDDIGRVYRHSYAFTKDYVDAHTFTENGKKYVEMSYTWKNMTPGAYTASEVKTSRYSLKNVINVEKGVYDSKGKVVNFTIKSNEEGKATFYNVKNTYKNLSHNSIAVNIFKK